MKGIPAFFSYQYFISLSKKKTRGKFSMLKKILPVLEKIKIIPSDMKNVLREKIAPTKKSEKLNFRIFWTLSLSLSVSKLSWGEEKCKKEKGAHNTLI
jgi:hypothetical protein